MQGMIYILVIDHSILHFCYISLQAESTAIAPVAIGVWQDCILVLIVLSCFARMITFIIPLLIIRTSLLNLVQELLNLLILTPSQPLDIHTDVLMMLNDPLSQLGVWQRARVDLKNKPFGNGLAADIVWIANQASHGRVLQVGDLQILRKKPQLDVCLTIGFEDTSLILVPTDSDSVMCLFEPTIEKPLRNVAKDDRVLVLENHNAFGSFLELALEGAAKVL